MAPPSRLTSPTTKLEGILMCGGLDPAPDRYHRRVYFSCIGSGPVIWEYKENHDWQPDLTWPQPKGRVFYREGDIILLYETSRLRPEDVFPELKGNSEDASLLKTLTRFMQIKFKYGYKIKRINVRERGFGTVNLVGVVFMDDGHTELLEPSFRSSSDLADSIAAERYWRAAGIVGDFYEEATNLVLGMLVGQGKTLVLRRLGARLIRDEIKKKLIAFGTKAPLAFAKAFVSELVKQKILAEVQAESADKTKIRKIVGPAVKKGAAAVINVVLDEILGSSISKKLERAQIKSEFRKFLLERLSKRLSLDTNKDLVDAIASASAKADNSEQSFESLLRKELTGKLKALLKAEIQSAVQKLIEDEVQ